MTLLTRALATVPDTTLPPTVPDFGLTLSHFYHPISFPDNGVTWADLVGSRPLTEDGDNTITQESEAGRPILRTTTTSSFFPGATFAGEVGSVFLVAKVLTADTHVGSSGILLHNRASSIAMSTTGGTTVTMSNGAGTTTAALDKWHLFSISTPTGTKISRFTVDGNSFTAGSAASIAPDTIRVGCNPITNRKQMSVAAVFSTAADLLAGDITGTVYPKVKAWWPELDWA